jgi:hypothetical protein
MYSLTTNENFQDYLNNFLNKQYSFIFLAITVIYFIGVINYNYKYYLYVTIANTLTLFSTYLADFIIYSLNKNGFVDYNSIIYMCIILLSFIIINNINLQFNNPLEEVDDCENEEYNYEDENEDVDNYEIKVIDEDESNNKEEDKEEDNDIILNIRITENDIWEIKNIFGNKISERELRILIRTINQIIQKKLV